MSNLPWRTRDEEITITEPPEGLSQEQKQAFIDAVREKGPFHGTFDEAAKLITGVSRSGAFAPIYDRALEGIIGKSYSSLTLGEETDNPIVLNQIPDGKTEEDVRPVMEFLREKNPDGGVFDYGEVMQSQEPEGEDEKTFNVWRALGGMARGRAPAALGALVGLPFGPIGSAVGALSMILAEGGINLANNLLGTDWKTPTEALGDLMTQAGVAEPETNAEMLLQRATQVTSGVGVAGLLASTVAGASALTAGGNPLVPTYMQQAAERLAPVLDTSARIGEGASELGAAGGARIAENREMGPVGQTLMPLGGAILAGGVTEAGLRSLGTLRDATRMAAARTTAPAGQRSPYSKTEIEAPTTMQGDTQQATGEGLRRGSGEYRYRRFNENQTELARTFQNAGVDIDYLGRVPDKSVALMNDYRAVRGAKLTTNTQARNGVIDSITATGATISPERGVAKLDELIQHQADLGASFSAQRAKIWEDLRNDITGAVHDPSTGEILDDINPRTMEQLQEIRADFGTRLKQPDMPGDMDKQLREVYAEIFGTYTVDVAEDGTKTFTRVPGDIDDFILANGSQADLDEFLVANRNLHEMATEFESRALNMILDEWAKPDTIMQVEVVRDAIRSTNPSTVQQVMNSLSDEGEDVAEQVFLGMFAENAIVGTSPLDMSLRQFTDDYREYAEQFGIVVNADRVKEIEGMVEHLNLTQHAEDFRRANTGYQGLSASGVGPGTGTAQSVAMRSNLKIGIPASILAALGASRWSRIKDQSPQIRRMFRELADLTPGSESSVRLSRLITLAIEQSEADWSPIALPDGPTTIPSWLPHSTP